MKKRLIISILAVFAVSVLSAQVSTDPADEFYDLVEHWEIMGIISEQPPLRPYPLKRVEAILTEVIDGEYGYESEVAEEYYERTFRRSYKLINRGLVNARINTENDEKEVTKQIIAIGGLGGDYQFSTIVTAGYDMNVIISTDISTDSLPVYSAQRYYFHDPVKVKSLEAYLEMDANFAVGTDKMYAQTGVNHLSFGPFYKNSAVISPDAKHTANFAFVYAGEKVSYTQGLLGLSASNVKGADGDLYSKKFLAVHSLNGELFPWFNVSFYEAAIYGDRFEPAYLIPAPFMVTQGLTGFDDNCFMGLSFTVRPVPGFVWVNDFFVDDIGLNDLIKLNFDTKLRGTFQTAFKWAPVNASWLDKAELSYTLVSPYMYTHKQNLINPATGNWSMGTLDVINYQEYTTAGFPLGLSLPPNTEQVSLSVAFKPVKNLKLTARGYYSRHCNVNESLPEDEALSYLNSPEGYLTTDGGIHNHQHYLKDGDVKNQGGSESTYLDSAWDHFLLMTQDTKMYTLNAGMDIAYTLSSRKYGSLSLDLGYTFEHIINYGVDNEIFHAMGGEYDSEGNWKGNATAEDVQKSLDIWRSNLRDISNHYVRFGLKFVW